MDAHAEAAASDSATPPGDDEVSGTRWRCPGCGSDELEALAWADVNTEQVTSFDENSDYWCPHCEETYAVICKVDPHGFCLTDHRPFAQCRAEQAGTPAAPADQTIPAAPETEGDPP